MAHSIDSLIEFESGSDDEAAYTVIEKSGKSGNDVDSLGLGLSGGHLSKEIAIADEKISSIFHILDARGRGWLTPRALQTQIAMNYATLHPIIIDYPALLRAWKPSRFTATIAKCPADEQGHINLEQFAAYCDALTQASLLSSSGGSFAPRRFSITPVRRSWNSCK